MVSLFTATSAECLCEHGQNLRGYMRIGLKSYRAPLTVVAVVALISLTPGAASADQDPVGLLGQVSSQTAKITKQLAPKAASAQDPSSASDSDLAGNETENPRSSDHGSAKVVNSTIAGQKVAETGSNDATVDDDDSTKADSTLLALGGEEILGTHADSNGENESHFGDPLAPLCEGSEGAACLTVLYAHAFATNDGSTSHSQSRSGIANACLGGSSTDTNAPCTGPVHAGSATSEGRADRNQGSGRTTASSFSNVVELCLQPEAVTGACAVGADVLHSEGQSDSGGSQASASRSSYLLGANAAGQELGPISDPTDLSLQPACADPSLACNFLNQGETYVGGSNAGHAQDALKATVLPGDLDAFTGVAHSESFAHNDGGDSSTAGAHGNLDPSDSATPDGSIDNANSAGSLLPNTGGVWSGLLALGLMAIAAGSFITAYGRRGHTLSV